jgi:type II secretory pathway component PulM
MKTLFLHLLSTMAILGGGWWLIVLPVIRRTRETKERVEKALEEMRLLAEAVKTSDRERREAVEEARKTLSNGVKEAGLAFDRMRRATSDLVRQEVTAAAKEAAKTYERERVI